jgi:aromatic-L-amino-acid decarboxylase
MFAPFDASLLLFRRPEAFRAAFSIVPEYLRTPEGETARNFNEYGIQLGRRFRALKMWMHIRWFGAEGMARRIREHCRQARSLAGWIDADPDWERLAPVPFSTVCLRHRPAAVRGSEDEPETAKRLDALNEAILERVNRTGRVFLSHTKLAGRYTLRVTLGNPRAREEHVRLCWDLLREAARETGV